MPQGKTKVMETDPLAGVICNGCGEEVYRILEGRCFPCWRGENVKSLKVMELSAKLEALRKKHPGYKVPRIRKNRR